MYQYRTKFSYHTFLCIDYFENTKSLDFYTQKRAGNQHWDANSYYWWICVGKFPVAPADSHSAGKSNQAIISGKVHIHVCNQIVWKWEKLWHGNYLHFLWNRTYNDCFSLPQDILVYSNYILKAVDFNIHSVYLNRELHFSQFKIHTCKWVLRSFSKAVCCVN